MAVTKKLDPKEKLAICPNCGPRSMVAFDDGTLRCGPLCREKLVVMTREENERFNKTAAEVERLVRVEEPNDSTAVCARAAAGRLLDVSFPCAVAFLSYQLDRYEIDEFATRLGVSKTFLDFIGVR
jgi:hypothetical protein